jgi:hypothetical protein
VEENALSRQTVAACAAALLLVVLDRFRHRGVDDAANVAPVDAHAERHGGDDDVELLCREVVLRAAALGRFETGVVGRGLDAVSTQGSGETLGVFSADAVHDHRFPGMAPNGIQYLLQRVMAGKHSIHQVRSVERADDDVRPLETELLDDVVAHPRRCGCRISVNARARKVAAQAGELAVLGSEVMAPLAYAVGFIDGKGSHLNPLEKAEERPRQQPFRRHEEQAHLSAEQGELDGSTLCRRQAAVDGRGRVAAELQRVHLVLHERDQGRDDNVHPAGHHWRHLVAERLASAGRQHYQGVALLEPRLDRFRL